MREALDIRVHGIVQGVGFRPFVYRAAKHNLIDGWVLNGIDGVRIHAEGEASDLDDFVLELSEHAPAASRVEEILLDEVPLEGFDSFEIRHSDETSSDATTLISPDLATCDDCIRELFDPADRRYRYPFINCTNCGPRYTIIDALPYDRPSTSMAAFPMCPTCAHEYADPADRRFHAQPDACFDCGPHIYWEEAADAATPADADVHENADTDARTRTLRDRHPELEWGSDLAASDAIIERACSWLHDGRILAVKGLGGFHLVCDAANPETLAELRTRKRREGKAFAVMAPSLDAVRACCAVSPEEERLLVSPAHPIVLLKKKPGAVFAAGLADDLSELGVMLPYTPLQHLMLAEFGSMLVMTSGNVHDEPIQTDDEAAWKALAGIADAFVGNDRAIETRFDDSVARVIRVGGDAAVQLIRRARGFAPMPIKLARPANGTGQGQEHADTPTILAVGPEQKNVLCLLRGDDAFASQHIGDMENAETFDAWLEAKNRLERLFDAKPTVIARDMHPEYLTSKWADEMRRTHGIRVMDVQHHHAHIVSAMAEHGIDDAVIGVAFDGTGYGFDGAIWGGEILIANRVDFERFANLTYVPMPGGAAAVKHPARMAFGALWAFDLIDHPAARPLEDGLGDAANVCASMMERGLNAPSTSSVGRIFDALSALVGICAHARYEGEAAVLFEAAIDGCETRDAYEIAIVKNAATAESTAHDTSVVLLDSEPLFRGVLDDLAAGTPVHVIAAKAHNAFVQAIVQTCLLAQAAYGIRTVVLSGGVFMNRYLIEHTIESLMEAGFTVVINRELPPNDGGLSYGQAAVASARLGSE